MTDQAEFPSLDFVHPIPGFPDHRRFVLVQLDDKGLLCALRSLDDPALRFLVVSPATFFPDYAPELDAETQEMLGIADAEDALVLLVVTPGASAADATANLLAPVIVATRTRRAAQVVLTGSDLPVRAPLQASGAAA
jgi:flagellar assembly factor FliW